LLEPAPVFSSTGGASASGGSQSQSLQEPAVEPEEGEEQVEGKQDSNRNSS